jgi:hypothetical protein
MDIGGGRISGGKIPSVQTRVVTDRVACDGGRDRVVGSVLHVRIETPLGLSVEKCPLQLDTVACVSFQT